MNQPARQTLSKRSKKACTECRQQKAKCDAYLNPDQPCSRCQKVKARCVISDPFKREHKRQRLSELEQETIELRRKLRSSENNNSLSSPIAMLTAAAEMGVAPGNAADMPALSPPQCPVGYTQPVAPRVDIVPPPVPRPENGPEVRPSERSIARTLNGVQVSGEEIDEIFRLFFQDYAPFMPILDPQMSPNAYYSQSPFLFWAVIGVACRSYPRNPTLLNALSRSIIEMALLSIASTTSTLHSIQGLLLILTWPFPREMNKMDVVFPLSGLLLHMAMQNGLHIPMLSHEFSKVRIPAPSEADMTRRSELWAHCVLVYQRACLCKGQSARSFLDLEHEPGQSQILFQRISPALMLEIKCQEISVRCCSAVLENGVRTLSADQERALDIIIRTYENQVKDVETQVISDTDRFHTTLCRLNIQMFHLYKNHTASHNSCLAKLLATACTVIDCVAERGKRPGSLPATPLYVFSSLMLASFILLRILKSSASRDLDAERAKSSLFLAINIAKQISTDSNDSAAKCVMILNQLWNSSKAFKKSDGTDTPLRIRSRLLLSPVLDAVWWWRDEFDSQYKPLVPPHSEPSDGSDSSRDNSGVSSNNSTIPSERQEPLHVDEQFLADFEWALGDDGLFAPTEPYGAMWPSSTNII